MNFYLLFCKESFTGRSFDKKMFRLIILHGNIPVKPLKHCTATSVTLSDQLSC